MIPHLAEALRRLEDDAHIVIRLADSIRYVQFATFRPNLRLETIGTRYLDDAGEPWSVDELVWLADHGWHDSDEDGNLWRHWIPADEDDAARAAVEALVNVHGVTSLEQVWFQSGDNNALAALEGHEPDAQPTADTTIANPAEHTGGFRGDLPTDARIFLLVDYVDSDAILELLARSADRVFRRHDGGWREDPEWAAVLSQAPARSIVLRPNDQLQRIAGQVDTSTAGQSWKPFRASQREMYWPSYRPNDPDLYDWSQLDSPDEQTEP